VGDLDGGQNHPLARAQAQAERVSQQRMLWRIYLALQSRAGR